MREAIVEENRKPKPVEEPIRYSLRQEEGHVDLDATVGGAAQTILRLYPHEVNRLTWVSTRIGLKMDGDTIAVDVE